MIWSWIECGEYRWAAVRLAAVGLAAVRAFPVRLAAVRSAAASRYAAVRFAALRLAAVRLVAVGASASPETTATKCNTNELSVNQRPTSVQQLVQPAQQSSRLRPTSAQPAPNQRASLSPSVEFTRCARLNIRRNLPARSTRNSLEINEKLVEILARL